MIRFLSTSFPLLFLILALYLPSIYPPERFLDQLRLEQQQNAALLDERHATRILERTLDFHEAQTAVPPASQMADAQALHHADNSVADAMSRVSDRFFGNAYFRSIRALFILVTYRCSTLIEWFPALLVFAMAVVFDGYLIRIVKSREFLQHDPQVYAAYACATIVTFGTTAIMFVLPITLHPAFIPLVPIAASIFISRAVANFHRRG